MAKLAALIEKLDTKFSGAIDRLDTKFGGELKAGLAETKNTILTWFVGTAIAFAGLTYSMTRPAPLQAQPPAATQQPAQPNNQKP